MKGLNNPAQYKQNPYYLKYEKQKLKVKKKYESKIDFTNERPGPSFENYDYNDDKRKMYKKYLKEVGDLLFKNNGWYQKFMWDIMSESDKIVQERKSRGRKSSPYGY